MMKVFKGIKNTFKDMDKVMLFIMILLSFFGLFNIVTASSREAVNNMDQSVYFYFYRHLAALIAGFTAFGFIVTIDTKKYHIWVPILFLIATGLNIFVIIHGTVTRGATNWLDLGFFNLQPSEVAKPVIIAILALYVERFGKKFRNPKVNHYHYIFPMFIIGLMIPLLVFIQKDLGTMLIQFSIFAMIYFFSPILRAEKWKIVGVVAAILVFFGLAFYAFNGFLLSEAQMSRFNYIDPCSKFASDGYQVCNAYVAINLGGLTGVGIGKSTQKYSYIPEPHTDMVFAILAEEYGFIVGAAIILIYAVLIYRLLMLSSRANTIRGKYMCLGIATYIMAHIVVNLGGLFGIIPLTGVPLPFLSYGGSFTLSLIAALGIAQRVHIETKRYKIKF